MVDASGMLVREVNVGSEPECLVGYFAQLDFPVERIDHEAGPLSPWLHAALVAGPGHPGSIVWSQASAIQAARRGARHSGYPSAKDLRQIGVAEIEVSGPSLGLF